MPPDAEAPLYISHPAPDPAWLAKAPREEIIDADLPIIDSHNHHFYEHHGYSYLLDDLLADMESGHNIVATVFLQAFWSYRNSGPQSLKPVGETERVVEMAAEADRRGGRTKICAGIVGYADLVLGGAVESVLAAHVATGAGRLRGIRYMTSRDPNFIATVSKPVPLGIMGSTEFRAGFGSLHKYGLSFDAFLYHPQIGELVDLARAFPRTPIVLDHLGGPLGVGPYRDRRQEVFADWRRSIETLATCSNVNMKLGGLGMVLSGLDFHKRESPPSSVELADAWEPYIVAAIEAFGVDRCMFESNFPPDKITCSYVAVWNAFKRIAAGATAHEKRALFHDTAKRFYRL